MRGLCTIHIRNFPNTGKEKVRSSLYLPAYVFASTLLVLQSGNNGFYRRHFCRDCLVTTEDTDNPDIECELQKESDAHKQLSTGIS